MGTGLKILLIIIAVLVGLMILSFAFNLISNAFDFIQNNITVIIGIVAVLSGLILLLSDKEDNSGLRPIAGIVLFTSVITLIGSFFGNAIDDSIGYLFK